MFCKSTGKKVALRKKCSDKGEIRRAVKFRILLSLAKTPEVITQSKETKKFYRAKMTMKSRNVCLLTTSATEITICP